MDMKFQQISAFKAVFELGTVTAAADYLHVTQPAISRLIAALERDVGFHLFERIKGRLLPTKEGQAFYHEVERSFLGLDRLKKSARVISQQRLGSLTIAAMPLLSNLFLPDVLIRYARDESPGMISLRTFRSEEVAQQVAIQACDLGFVLDTEFGAGVTGLKVSCDCVCILPPGHVLADMPGELTPPMLAGTSFIRNEKDPAQNLLDQAMQEAGIHQQDFIEVSFASSLASLVAGGLGGAITDPFTAHIARNQNEQVTIHRFSPRLPFEFYLLFPALRPLASAVRQFLTLFFENAKDEGIHLHVAESASVRALFECNMPWEVTEP